MAVKCPFCGDRIEAAGEASGGLVPCPTCHATVDVHLADPLPDAPDPSRPVQPVPRGEAPQRPVPGLEPPVGVGSYSLRSNDMKHAKEAVFNPASARAAAEAEASRRPAAPPETPPPSHPSVAYRPEQFLGDTGPEIPASPDATWDRADMNQTLDRLSEFVTAPAPAPTPPPPPPPAAPDPFEIAPGGVRLDDLDLSFDDLRPLKSPESAGLPRAAGDPGTTLDLDAVMREESFTEALPPWAEPDPGASRAKPSAESPWNGAAPRSSDRAAPPPAWDAPHPESVQSPWDAREPGATSNPLPGSFGDDWSLPPPSGAVPPAGVPPTSDYDFNAAGSPQDGFGESLFEGAPMGSLQLDIPAGSPGSGTASGTAAPPGAAPLPAGRKARVAKSSSKSGAGGKSIVKALLLGGLLIVLVGLILGQTEYGFFGLNLLGGKGGGGSSTRRSTAAGSADGAIPDRRDAWQKEVVRLQRLLIDSPKDEALRGELLMVLSRLRERYPAAVASDPAASSKLQELLAQVRLPGERADLVKAMDLMAGSKWDAAKAILDRLQAAAPTDALLPYLLGKVALGQDRLDDAQRAFESALAKDPAMVAATYFDGRVLLKKKELAKARGMFESILGREVDHLPARLGLGEVALASGDVEGAARLAGEVISKAQPGADGDDIFGAHVLLARVEDQKGSKEGRLRELRAALGIRPTDAIVAVEVSTLLRADGKSGEALAVLGPAREAGRDGEDFLAAYALAAFADDKADLAETAVAEGVQKHPKTPTFHVLRGRHELGARRLRSAASSFEAALQADPACVDAWTLLAQGLASEGRVGEAVERLKEGLGKTGQSAQLLLALAGLQKEQRDLVNAETTLRQAVAKDPSNVKAHQDLGLIVAAQGRMEEASKILLELDGKRQLDRDGVLGLARALMSLQQAGKAREVLQRVHDTLADDWDVAAELGRAMFEAGQDAEAETVLRKVLQQRPSHHVSYYYLGQLLARRGDREGAIAAFENSIKGNSRDPLPRIQLARLYVEGHDAESTRLAKNQLDAVLAAYSRNEVPEEERDPDAYLMHGRILFNEQKYTLAMKDFEAALARAPTRIDILVGFARALFEAARYDDARPYLRQVLSRDPQHPEANYLMGRIKVREGKTREAREHLERVVKRDPRSFPDANRVLGMIYRDEGLQALARSAFQSYLRHADPKSAEAEEVRQLLARMR